MGKVWEPVSAPITDQWNHIVWQHKLRSATVICIQGKRADQMSVEIPPEVSLCRLVPAPEPAAVERTAQEFVAAVKEFCSQQWGTPNTTYDIGKAFFLLAAEWGLEGERDE